MKGHSVGERIAICLCALLLIGSAAGQTPPQGTNAATLPMQRGPLHELGLQFLAAADTLSGGPGAMYEASKQLRQQGIPLPKMQYVRTFYAADGTSKQETITTYEEMERVITETRAIHASSMASIRKHGFQQLSNRYIVTVSAQCSEKWVAAGEVNVEQKEFVFELSQGQKKFLGAMVESAASVIFPGGFEAPLTGELREGHLNLGDSKGCLVRMNPLKNVPAKVAGLTTSKEASGKQADRTTLASSFEDQITHLHAAAYNGDTREAERLISNGAGINVMSKKGATPLHLAVQMGHRELAELLIAKGADVNAKDMFGFSPLHHAVTLGDLSVSALLVDKGADVDAKDKNAATPLHFAAYRGRMDLVQLLIAKGADVNAKDKDGKTPLTLAISKGNSAVAELLRRHRGN